TYPSLWTDQEVAFANLRTQQIYNANYNGTISSGNSIFTYPSLWTDQEVAFANLRTQQIYNANYNGTISSGNSMDKECFYKIGDNSYFIPPGINYYFYRIDTKEMKFDG
ncbi:hypothetical protein DWZ57_13690, partial [Bacteroides fragilis]